MKRDRRDSEQGKGPAARPSMITARTFAMPSAATFCMKPVRELLKRWLDGHTAIVDPFARNSGWALHSNDIDQDTQATHHMEARDFLATLKQQGLRATAVLFDPPYSPRQIAEHYRKAGKTPTTEDTQNARLYREVRDGLDELLEPSGIAISFGWSSAGFGDSRGYETLELLLVNHGGAHNDTICIVERKGTARGARPQQPTPSPKASP